MNTLLSLLLALTVSSAFADTFTLYFVRGDAHLFDGAANQDLLPIIYGDKAVIEVFIQTEGTSLKGTNQTHPIDYTQEWDESGTPKSKASREVGTTFRVVEKGDLISYEFSDTRLERWISISPPKPLLQPVFTSEQTNSQITLKKGSLAVIGGLSREETRNGVSHKILRYIIIGRQ